jgi:hypothetical protein
MEDAVTIEQHDLIDFVGMNAEGHAVLTISDHLSWDEIGEHLYHLQEKLNAYLRFIESGEIYDKFPRLRDRPIAIDVVLKHPAPQEAQWFFAKTAAAIADAGFTLNTRQISHAATGRTTQPDNWTAVDVEIDRIITGSVEEPFAPSTIANVREFVTFARANCPVPQIAKGYWSTICFGWETIPPREIEVFGDRFEVYRFYEGRSDIEAIAHAPGSPLPPELVAYLPRRNSN